LNIGASATSSDPIVRTCFNPFRVFRSVNYREVCEGPPGGRSSEPDDVLGSARRAERSKVTKGRPDITLWIPRAGQAGDRSLDRRNRRLAAENLGDEISPGYYRVVRWAMEHEGKRPGVERTPDRDGSRGPVMARWPCPDTVPDDELERFKRDVNLPELAASHGYLLATEKRPGTTAASVSMRHPMTDDKIVIRRDRDGHWTYVSVRDDRDNGTVIDFVQRRHARSLGAVRQQLRAWLKEERRRLPVQLRHRRAQDLLDERGSSR
jgi:hypothetical protein